MFFALYMSLDANSPHLARWTSADANDAAEGLPIGFLKFLFLVDGKKNKQSRSKNDRENIRSYNGNKKTHAWEIVVLSFSGRFIRLEVSDEEQKFDHYLYESLRSVQRSS